MKLEAFTILSIFFPTLRYDQGGCVDELKGFLPGTVLPSVELLIHWQIFFQLAKMIMEGV